jgi:hypothetical protein
MFRRFNAPSPALVIACIALFVALGGTAIAAAPPVKRALFANNAGKLQGKTAAQIAALPGPARGAANLLSVRTAPFALTPDGEGAFSVPCGAGEKAISGGFKTPNFVVSVDTLPTNDGRGWQLYLINLSTTQVATGTLQAVCIR